MDDGSFCGEDIPIQATSFVPRSVSWQSADLLGSLTRADVRLDS
jgi:hypothetical protein